MQQQNSRPFRGPITGSVSKKSRGKSNLTVSLVSELDPIKFDVREWTPILKENPEHTMAQVLPGANC
jgi:hypothetical protein